MQTAQAVVDLVAFRMNLRLGFSQHAAVDHLLNLVIPYSVRSVALCAPGKGANRRHVPNRILNQAGRQRWCAGSRQIVIVGIGENRVVRLVRRIRQETAGELMTGLAFFTKTLQQFNRNPVGNFAIQVTTHAVLPPPASASRGCRSNQPDPGYIYGRRDLS